MLTKEDEARLLISRMRSLPTLPSVMGKVMEVLKNNRSSASDLVEVIRFDQSLSLKILGLSNSAIYGFPRRITSVSEAVVILGFDLVKVLALSLPVFEMAHGNPALSDFLKRLWAHSYKTALLSGALSEDLGVQAKDSAFLGGLLADMGRAAFAHIDPAGYAEVVGNSGDGGTMMSLERERMGVDHPTASGWIADDFLLPEDVVYVMKYHHNPLECPEGKDTAMVVYLADFLLSMEGHDTAADGYAVPDHDKMLKHFGLEGRDLQAYKETVLQKMFLTAAA